MNECNDANSRTFNQTGKHDLKMKSENGGSLIRKFKVAIAQEIRCNHQLKTAPRDVNARPLFALRFYWWPQQKKRL